MVSPQFAVGRSTSSIGIGGVCMLHLHSGKQQEQDKPEERVYKQQASGAHTRRRTGETARCGIISAAGARKALHCPTPPPATKQPPHAEQPLSSSLPRLFFLAQRMAPTRLSARS